MCWVGGLHCKCLTPASKSGQKTLPLNPTEHPSRLSQGPCVHQDAEKAWSGTSSRGRDTKLGPEEPVGVRQAWRGAGRPRRRVLRRGGVRGGKVRSERGVGQCGRNHPGFRGLLGRAGRLPRNRNSEGERRNWCRISAQKSPCGLNVVTFS